MKSAVARGATHFSIVIPSLNQGMFVGDAIASLVEQHYPNVDILVVDGGSSDGTRKVLESYGAEIRWISEPDEGQSHAIQKGMAMMEGSWCSWLNADDVHIGNALFRVDQAIQATPAADLVVGRGCYIDENGRRTRPYPTIPIGESGDVSRELFLKGYVAQPSVFFRREAYERVGGIDRRIVYAMDYDLWVRLAKSEARFTFLDEELSGNRWHASTKTSRGMLDLLSEVVSIQLREYGIVSPYFVQAVSDSLYSLFHSRPRGDAYHLLFRWLYFKAVWTWLNYQKPLYLIGGLATETIAMSGPLVGDRFDLRALIHHASTGLSDRLKGRMKI
jgi:glycosyltransferase involved in cell wall biosynthesis